MAPGVSQLNERGQRLEKAIGEAARASAQLDDVHGLVRVERRAHVAQESEHDPGVGALVLEGPVDGWHSRPYIVYVFGAPSASATGMYTSLHTGDGDSAEAWRGIPPTMNAATVTATAMRFIANVPTPWFIGSMSGPHTHRDSESMDLYRTWLGRVACPAYGDVHAIGDSG